MWKTKILNFYKGNQIGVYRGDDLICVANLKGGQASDIQFTDPKYLKSNKTRQKAIDVLKEALG